MVSQLPSPKEIAGHYNRLMQEVQGDYIHARWGDSEIKRRHYRQTELALRHALEHVGPLGDVLEIGCGPAVWTPLWLPGADRLVLLDISEGMLSKARERISAWESGRHAGKVGYSCGDFLETTVEGRFGTIFSARAFEYMSDKREFVRKCFELLREGGSLVLITKNKEWRDLRRTAKDLKGVAREEIPIGTAMHLDLVAWSEVQTMFETAGFQAVSTYPVIIGSYLPPFTWPGGLALNDAIHRHSYRRPIARILDPLVESYLVVGRKPGSRAVT